MSVASRAGVRVNERSYQRLRILARLRDTPLTNGTIIDVINDLVQARWLEELRVNPELEGDGHESDVSADA